MARVKTRVKNQSAACGKFFKDLSTQNVNIICEYVPPNLQVLDLDARSFMQFASPDRFSIGAGGIVGWRCLRLGPWTGNGWGSFLLAHNLFLQHLDPK